MIYILLGTAQFKDLNENPNEEMCEEMIDVS